MGFCTGQTQQQFPAFANTRTLCVTLLKHSAHIQSPMTLPPDPSLFLAHGKAHKTPTQSQPCQELKNAYAQPTHPS